MNCNFASSCLPTDDSSSSDLGEKALFARQNLSEVSIPLERTNDVPAGERSFAFDDLHGVATFQAESPRENALKLVEMDRILSNLSTVYDREAFDFAVSKQPEYVDGVRLRFLRKMDHNPSAAAERMMLTFQLRKEYFGWAQTTRDLTIQDLKEEDMPFLRRGMIQLLPERDRSGRAILVAFAGHSGQTPIDTLVRLILFLSEIAVVDDVEVQRKGFVFIYFGIGHQQQYSGGRINKLAQGIQGSPMRVAAIHACYDSPVLHPVMSLGAMALEARTLIRFKCHFGSALECVYSLMTYGIPMGTIPVNLEDGSINVMNHQRIISEMERQAQEQQSQQDQRHKDDDDHDDDVKKLLVGSEEDVVAVVGDGGAARPVSSTSGASAVSSPSPAPTEEVEVIRELGPLDIVVGRGQGGTKSTGNQRLKRLQEEYQDQYERATRFDKIVIGQTLFATLKESGYRFLTRSKDKTGWVKVSDQAAKDTIAHGFRNLRRVAKEKKIPILSNSHH
eukprot:Nitzschia sp. Nitz4//scaffold282_size24342//13522//15114//NITZ4_008355-RA/size24342-augustus-gene-0.16-mRNA-1//-1//CDS//3329545629//2960//frame0